MLTVMKKATDTKSNEMRNHRPKNNTYSLFCIHLQRRKKNVENEELIAFQKYSRF